MKYTLTIFSNNKELKETVIQIIQNTFSKIEIYPLVEDGNWELIKDNGFTEEEFKIIVDNIIKVIPKIYFYLSMIEYNSWNGSRLFKYCLKYDGNEINEFRDMI